MIATIITDMEIDVHPGRYVVAVSGGVDSMSLLHLLHGKSGLDLVVAYFDHGIRRDSVIDRELVRKTATAYGLPFVTEAGRLGAGASEAIARAARYDFLERVRRSHHAAAIITAHHQDDLLETAILNLLRGTGRKGLTSLTNRDHILRPLLHVTKQELTAYAREHHLDWYEDSTNTDERYLRNYIRRRLLPRFDEPSRAKLLGIIEHTKEVNQELDAHLINILHCQPHTHELDRAAFALLPHAVAKELLASWWRLRGVGNFDARTLERVVIAAKTQPPGTIIDIIGGFVLRVTKYTLALEHRER